jgi:hypothetical protein
MTQIIAALTPDYVLVASDRRLTLANGPRRGEVLDDDTCKLVLLCGVWGIAYTGFARLQGTPTHEWIALTLAKANCRSPYVASQVLSTEGAKALKAANFQLEQTFLMAGWSRNGHGSLQPHFLLVTNMHDPTGKRLDSPADQLSIFERRLQSSEAYVGRVIGEPLDAPNGKRLDRTFRRMLRHGTSPRPAMQAFVQQISCTSDKKFSVGKKVLAFSIPKIAAEHAFDRGGSVALAAEPDLTTTAFCYFDPLYSQLRQYGPTIVCGQSAMTDVGTVNDSTTGFQSSSVRILHLPDTKTEPPST